MDNLFSPAFLHFYFQVYLILWFWFFSLLVLTGLQLILRLATIAVPPLRLGLLILRSRSYNSDDVATLRWILKCEDIGTIKSVIAGMCCNISSARTGLWSINSSRTVTTTRQNKYWKVCRNISHLRVDTNLEHIQNYLTITESVMSFTWMMKIFMQSPQSKELSRHVVIAKKRNDKVVILSLPCFV